MPFQARAPSSDRNVWSEYEIQAITSLTDRPLRNLKHGDAFAVLDTFGDCGVGPDTAEGLYYRDTRFLSRLELRIEGKRPLLLISAAHENKAALTVELTNPDLTLDSDERLARDSICLTRTKFLRDGICYERIAVRNFSSTTRSVRLDVLYDADFRDLFEIRGTQRRKRGSLHVQVPKERTAIFSYRGLDSIIRNTTLRFFPEPIKVESNRSTWQINLLPYEQKSIFLFVQCNEGESTDRCEIGDYLRAYRNTRRERLTAVNAAARIRTNNDVFEEIVARATSDIYTLVTYTDCGPFPYAGIPWFSTVFGRDGIFTAMFMLWVDPSIAKGVLRMLASTQAKSTDPFSDAQPGKILHELRQGEMANLGEIPFGHYYGSVDATPLFVMLAGMYFQQTGDANFIRDIWSNIRAALHWINHWGDPDRDGFVEYSRAAESGLANQGWKDSYDAIFDEHGKFAEGPIALCEVQGYVFAAKRHAAEMAAALGDDELSRSLVEEAERLRKQFEDAFWCEELQTYAVALDGRKRRCRVRGSNAGHALFTRIAAPERAGAVARSLFSTNSFSGWGVRTLSVGEPRYNPMSYHNGSVWPHDNALIALGLSHYGMKEQVSQILSGLFGAARYQELRRLPELFCGFKRRSHLGPTPYPVACSPQAWAAAALFALIKASLGLELSHKKNEIVLRHPILPAFVDELEIQNLRLGSSCLHLRMERQGLDVTAAIASREGSAGLVLLK